MSLGFFNFEVFSKRIMNFKILYLLALFIIISNVVFCVGENKNDSLKQLLEKEDLSIKEKVKIYNKQGVYNWEKGNYEEAMQLFRKILKISDSIKYAKYQAMALNNIGFIYAEYGNHKKSFEYYLKGLEIRKNNNDEKGIGLSCNSIGRAYLEMDSLDKSLEYFNKSLVIFRNISYSKGESNVLNSIGNLYFKKQQFDLAMKYYKLSLKIRKSKSYSYLIAESYKNIAKAYIGNKNYKDAEAIIKKGILISNEIHSKKMLKEFYYQSYELNIQSNNYQKALIDYLKFTEINDSILSIESQNRIAELETQYQTEKKEQQIEILNTTNLLKEEKIKKQKVFIQMITGGFIVFTFMFVILVILYIQKRKAHINLIKHNIKAIEDEKQLSVCMGSISKYTNSNLDDKKKQKLLDELIALMEKEKCYLNSKFSIEDLAKKLDTNRQYISQLINETFHKNFNHFVNEYRIKEARLLLVDSNNNKYSIEGISATVGFNNRTSFITSFKKYTGVTPSFFKKNYQNI